MVFFRVLPKICLSLIPTERGRFSRCFPKYSQFLYISPGRGPFLSGFQISPQRVASEKTVFYLCFVYFFTCSHLERSKVVPASKFSSSRGRSREKPKIKPFEKIFFFPQQVGNEDDQKPRLCRKYFSPSSGRARKRGFYEWLPKFPKDPLKGWSTGARKI